MYIYYIYIYIWLRIRSNIILVNLYIIIGEKERKGGRERAKQIERRVE